MRTQVNSFVTGAGSLCYFVEVEHSILGLKWWSEYEGTRSYSEEEAIRRYKSLTQPTRAPRAFQ